ncbi:phosphoribosyltransferase family protein [Paradesertivirga mongoliensis]|uniref:Phosphoribosyltransferase family protein n=1 Tax=Paradesertivirga mongoliensis TaxID=2100740 RepID=A0ABW4ZKA6_9SPHI|nr:phosphoribosyltransferase family protein [Pedobacter mongoliensis]
MPDKKILILDKKQIRQKITRMSYQIWEDNLEESELIIAGIIDSGYTLAKRLQKELQRVSGIKVTLMKISLDKDSSHLKADTDIPVENCTNKVVILADDVLNSGRTLAYGLGVFLNTPLKKLRTAVLVNRSHRKFPISADFTGLDLATIIKEHVDVILDGDEDAVYLR